MGIVLSQSLAFSASSVMSVLLMAIGFGLVIFIHELGHFLAAKMVGIRVERFAIGFGRKLLGFTWGETEYCINVLPLGGYVKMPGQEDFDLQSEDDDSEPDPMAFNNRPIWARMIVVSAGVVMNVLLAAVLFVIIFSIGREYMPATVGSLRPGYPAEEAVIEGLTEKGLRPGDVIETINGQDIYSFDSLGVKAILSDPEAGFRFRIRRPGVDKPLFATVGVAPAIQARGSIANIFGISPTYDMLLSSESARSQYISNISSGIFKGGDRIVSINGVAITEGWQLNSLSDSLGPQPVEVIAERKKEDGTTEKVTAHIDTSIVWTSDVYRRCVKKGLDAKQDPPFPAPEFSIAGLVPRVMVDMADPDSPAAVAGLQHGDIIVSFGPAYESVSHAKMQEICARNANTTIPISVLRDGEITDDVTKIFVGEIGGTARIGILVGIEKDRAVIGDVSEDSPFHGLLSPGQTITSVNGQAVTSWPEVISHLALSSSDTCVLGYRSLAGADSVTAPVSHLDLKFDLSDYGYDLPLPLEPLMEVRKSANPWQAIQWGTRATGNFILMTYATLEGFFTGKVSGKEFSGPIGIFRLGVSAGERGPMWLLWLLAIISANLAVINFLPLPIVDGGLAIMLIIEKLRGKPLGIKVQNAIQVVGLMLIAVAFVLLTYNDIKQWIMSKW